MDKLLEVLAELARMLIKVSPATGVLFFVVCALAWVCKHLFNKNAELHANSILQYEKFQETMRSERTERERSYNEVITQKEQEITDLHKQNADRDQTTTKVLDSLRQAIRSGNTQSLTQSCWNGIEAIGRAHNMDVRDMNMLDHMKPQPPSFES